MTKTITDETKPSRAAAAQQSSSQTLMRGLDVIEAVAGGPIALIDLARQLGLNRRTINRWIASGQLDRELDTGQVPRPVRKKGPTKLDPYKPLLEERLRRYPELTAVRLFGEIRAAGYPGGITQLKRFVQQVRPKQAPEPLVRFETEPGQQMQVDFVVIRRARQRLSAFVATLGYSRMAFVRFVTDETWPTVQSCLHATFGYFGGMPRELLFDNMKTVVLERNAYGRGQHRLHPGLLALSRDLGFAVRLCRPYRAKTKGKVERPFSYIRQDFFFGRSFRNLDDLNGQLTDWLDTVANARTHGTTQRVVAEAFAAEQPELQTLPEHRFDAVLKLERRVSHDGFIAVGGNYYSVPDRTRRVVEVQQLPDLIRVVDLGNIVAEHPVLEGRRQYRIDRSHRTGGTGVKRRSGIAAGITIGRIGDHVPMRSLAVYQAIGSHLATGGRP